MKYRKIAGLIVLAGMLAAGISAPAVVTSVSAEEESTSVSAASEPEAESTSVSAASEPEAESTSVSAVSESEAESTSVSAASESASEEVPAESSPEDELDPEMAMLMSLPLVEGEYELSDCVTLGEYKGLELTAPSAAVTDEEVEQRVRARLKPEEVEDENAVVEEGDTARIAFVGKKDGVAFDGGTSDSYDLVIGSGSFIDGFEDGIIGMKKGETKDLNLTFPEAYNSAELAGQDVVFTVTVNAILRTPELSDEWAAGQGEGEYKTLEEYLAHQKEVIERQKERTRLQSLQGDAWYELQKASTFYQLPAEYATQGEELFEDDVLQEAAAYGLDLDTYLTAAGMDKEQYEEMKQQYGRYAAMSRILLEAMVEAEDLSTDSDEYQEELEKLAGELEVDADSLFEDHDKETVDQYLLTQMASNRIISYASVTEE